MATILVVDDSPVDRKIAGGCVEALGSNPVFAQNGREALEKIKQSRPDIVLTDLLMPEMDGLHLVECVRRDYPDVPVVLMTAFGSEETAVAALRAGASSYVPKRDLKFELGEALRPVLAAVDARHRNEQVLELLDHSESEFVLGSDPEACSALVGYLQEGLSRLSFCDQTGLFQVGTALAEALSNAVDHGNLELDSALREAGDNSYDRLRVERSSEPEYCDRRVHVTVRLSSEAATYVIRDDGHGFDPSSLPDPRDAENLLRASGRGIMLIRTFMDEVAFNPIGNEITMTKCGGDVSPETRQARA